MLFRCAEPACRCVFEIEDGPLTPCPKCDGLKLIAVLRPGDPVLPWALTYNDQQFLKALHITWLT